MSLFFLSNGLQTTIQDLGRNGFRKSGINQNGVMDRYAARLNNILIGNDENEAVLEMHFPAPVLEFRKNAIISIGGADFGSKIDNKPLDYGRPVFIEKGQTLKFSKKNFGNRAYLAIKGGFEIENWLESASTNLAAEIGGFRGRSLQKGDEIFFKEKGERHTENFDYLISSGFFLKKQGDSNSKIRIIAGAEFDYLTGWSEESLLKSEFTITKNSDRMGFRLDGQTLFLLDEFELISSAVSFGTIQLLPDGQMIILMADHQTTGGYPRIAHVISNDLSGLAQLGTNNKIGFDLIKIDEAERLLEDFEREINLLKLGCKFRGWS